VLNVPAAIAQELDDTQARVPEQAFQPAPQKAGAAAWLYSFGNWLPIEDPCSYPQNYTIDGYRQALEKQGYRYEGEFFDLNTIGCSQASEVAAGFAIYVADEAAGRAQHPPYPYRVDACLVLCDTEPPISTPNYPSLLLLLATFAPIVETRVRIAHLAAQAEEEEHVSE